MAKIVFLGTASAIADQTHDNTHLLIQNEDRIVLVDCGGNPGPRLIRTGIDPDRITDLLLTHFHPDHVAGAPLWLMNLWLQGRTQTLTVHGLEHTIQRLQAMLDLYEWGKWPDFFPVIFKIIPEDGNSLVIQDSDLVVTASPVKHLLPTIGIRIDIPLSGASAAYSSDTEPCDAVISLAEDVDVLIHEASGASMGHSSAQQAGEIARKSGARSLVLIHYSPSTPEDELIHAAKEAYPGPVSIARDFDEFSLRS